MCEKGNSRVCSAKVENSLDSNSKHNFFLLESQTNVKMLLL